MANLPLKGGELRHRRERAGMSVKALAQKVEVSSHHLYRLESGRRNPSPELYGKLIRALGLRLGDLLGSDNSAAEDAA